MPHKRCACRTIRFALDISLSNGRNDAFRASIAHASSNCFSSSARGRPPANGPNGVADERTVFPSREGGRFCERADADPGRPRDFPVRALRTTLVVSCARARR